MSTTHDARGFIPDKLAKFEADLIALEFFLKRAEEPVTARQIFQRFACSKQAGYFRLRALKKRHGDKLKVSKVREGIHGPWSRGYMLRG